MARMSYRVEVGDLPRPDRLRPNMPAIDTYAAPERPPIDNNKQRLAEALSAFSSALAGLARGAGKVSENDPRLADAYRIMSSATDDRFIAGLQQGTLPWQDVPHIRSLYEADAGQRAARQALTDIQIGAKDGTVPLVDPEGRPVDTQALIGERATRYMTFPQSPHFMKSFSATIEAGRNSIAEMQRARVAEVNHERNQTLVKSALEDVVGFAAEGRDDDFIRQEWNRRTELAWKVTGTRPADVDALWIGRLKELAKQNPDAAERLLKLDRGKGFDGQPIGSLAGNPTYRKDVEEIAAAINDEREKRFDVAERDRLSAEAQRRLEAADGSFNAITNHSYVNPFAARDPSKNAHRMITREQLQDEALSRFLQRSDAEFKRQGIDPATSPAAAETKFRREYEAFVNANRPHPVWQSTLSTTGRILSNPTSLSDPRNVERVTQAYQLYRTLAERNPAYAKQTLGVNEREQRFYEQMRVYQETLGDPFPEAARKAADYVNNPPPPLTGEEIKELRQKVDTLDLNGWSLGGKVKSWFGEAVQNSPTLRNEVFEATKAIAADRKVPAEKALEAAVERVQSRTTLFNGQVIPPNAYLTQESAPFYQKRLDELWKQYEPVLKNAYDIGSATGLSLREETPGVFRVVGSNGETIIIPQQRPDGTMDYSPLRVFSRDIDTIRAQSKQETVKKVLESQKDAADDAIINAPRAVDIVRDPSSPDGLRAIIPPTQQQRDEARSRKLKRRYGDETPTPVEIPAGPSFGTP